MLYWFQTILRPVVSGIYFPFKIYHRASIKIKKNAGITLKGRLTLGNPDKHSAVVSLLPINLFFGRNTTITIGHSVSIGPGVNIIVKDNAQLSIGNHTY